VRRSALSSTPLQQKNCEWAEGKDSPRFSFLTPVITDPSSRTAGIILIVFEYSSEMN